MNNIVPDKTTPEHLVSNKWIPCTMVPKHRESIQGATENTQTRTNNRGKFISHIGPTGNRTHDLFIQRRQYWPLGHRGRQNKYLFICYKTKD